MYRMAVFDEPLLIHLPQRKEQVECSLEDVPKSLRRERPPAIPNLEENQVVRHFFRLSQMNYGIETGMYPLGSCTMKYNPKICEEIANWEEFKNIHPYQDVETVQGTLEILYNLERFLCELTGMHAFTLQPSAGAHGEFLGILLAKAYHEFNGEERNEVIIPDTAHGTNPASASMAGCKVIEVPSDKEGMVDIDALEKVISDKTACFMLTNPNTLGIFESNILEIARIVHDAGSLLYYDGANLNAILGISRPGDMGFDIVHLNLHKTFATPHGGGGPGAGPIGVKEKLEKFLPVPRIKKVGRKYVLDYDCPHSIGKIREFYGNVEACIKAYVYLLLLGKKGLKEVAEVSVLNSNYMKERLKKARVFDIPYKDLKKHEFVVSCERLRRERGIRALDIAKRLIDYGFHPPTIYFPLIVKEALMIEPTESETKEDIDRYVDALVEIANEDPEIVKQAPHKAPVKRVDEVFAARNPILTWKDI